MRAKMMAMILYSFVIGNTVNIAALIYGFNSSQACKDDPNSVIMNVDTYLISGASVIIGSSLYLVVSCLLLLSKDDDLGTISQMCVSAVIIIFALVWAIIGLVLHDQINSACADSDTGKMLLAFAIIPVLIPACICCPFALLFFLLSL